jgi:Dual specificity phosphatase, catalytic domain
MSEWPCPVCQGYRDPEQDCLACGGRGVLDAIPWADRPRDEVVPGLWVGGHVCQPSGAPPDGHCYISPDEGFDLVVSLFYYPGFDPPEGVIHHQFKMADADLDPEHHTRLDELTDIICDALAYNRKVLVRCQAGLNRSSLVVALTMIKMGWQPWEAIERIRAVRSPYALCNYDFVEYLMEQAA